ncbi:uncharacterized protein V1513DRAFT_439991 [Lipomyces chichibuensis]|uniref:uncharacterized protein n=1 Tax=Lipomyces chichibuensis TaxID=1546026 RepID=UPI003343B921
MSAVVATGERTQAGMGNNGNVETPLASNRQAKYEESVGAKKIKTGFNSSDVLNNGAPNNAGDMDNDGGEFEVPKSEIRKRKRKEKRRSRLFPSFDVDPSAIKDKINVADLRDLVLWILADGVAPKWLSIYNKLGITRIATILVPGLTPDLFGVSLDAVQPVSMSAIASKMPQELAFFRDHFGHLWPTRAPGDRTKLFSPMTAFMNSPLPKAEKTTMQKNGAPKLNAVDSSVNVPLKNLLLSAEEFVDGDYPIHSATIVADDDDRQELAEGWVESVPRPADIAHEKKGTILVQNKYRVYGLDCEMCLTTHGSALARVTVVNWNREVVMDELVLPDNTITDYLTQYSGITAKMLENVSTTLSDVQKQLTSFIYSGDILVGHSLENDLKALKLRHPAVIDTSVIYHHSRGLPSKPSLKWLAQKFLKKEIQQLKNGHDSAEDARTCIDLVKLKIEKGMEFGTCVPSTEPLLRRLARAATSGGAETSGLHGRGVVVDYGNPAQWHGTDARTIVGCKNDEEVVRGVVESIGQHEFVWARMREVEFNRGWVAYHGLKKREKDLAENRGGKILVTNGSGEDTNGVADEKTNHSDGELQTSLINLNKRLEKIWDSIPPATAVIIMSGSGDPREMSRLNAMRAQFTEEFKSKKWDEVSVKWTDTENQQLLEAAKVARAGVSFIAIKGPSDHDS